MRLCFSLLLGLSLACATADVSLEGGLTRPDLAGTWLEVSEHEGKAVLLTPCDGALREIRVQGERLVVGWGQEATEYTIKSAKASGEALQLEVLAQGSDSPQTVGVERTPRGLLWTLEDSQFDTLSSKTAPELPRVKECCGSTEEEPVPHRLSVIAHDQACP